MHMAHACTWYLVPADFPPKLPETIPKSWQSLTMTGVYHNDRLPNPVYAGSVYISSTVFQHWAARTLGEGIDTHHATWWLVYEAAGQRLGDTKVTWFPASLFIWTRVLMHHDFAHFLLSSFDKIFLKRRCIVLLLEVQRPIWTDCTTYTHFNNRPDTII